MAIMTVRGPIRKEDAGICLPHEHLLIDLRGLVERPDFKEDPEFYRPLQMNNRRLIYSDPYRILDNALIDNIAVAADEVSLARASGVCTIVDVTLDEIGRDPAALRSLSEACGVHIVMGCGHYIDAALPESVRRAKEEDLAAEMIRDLREGVRGTEIRAGVIGEIGTSAAVTQDEWRSVRAAGMAGAETGAAVQVHTSLWEENGVEVAKTLLRAGVKSKKICINHIDVALRPDYLKKLLDLGVMIEFDNFGKEFYISPRENGLLKGRFAYDLERCKLIADLVKDGYCGQILVCNDICLKNMLCAYGGNGYGHITDHIVPMLEDVGLSRAQVEKILIENPADFLDMEAI